MGIVNADVTNLKEWTELAVLLFPESSFEEELQFHQEILFSEKEIGYLYFLDNQYVGFMNISIRSDYVNGTATSPVVYIEAIYVLPEYRKKGIGQELIQHAEAVARERGIKEVASDCLIDNMLSEKFHKGCGFEEKERVICFVKKLPDVL